MSSRKYKKIGFDKKETEKLVEVLNALLANYHLHYQKLRNFHWNVKGGDFFDLHEQFEQRYDIAKESIDEIAERIRVFGHTPLSNLSDYLKQSDIKESSTDLSGDQMVEDILKDYETLLSFLTDAMNAAIDIGDVGTGDMLNTFIQDMEKHHWMLSSFMVK
ncbi:MAG: starvation-inducible DNA-binding protein [Marivirga sp.]|jgi:starvation-inducible DNA-binding protein